MREGLAGTAIGLLVGVALAATIHDCAAPPAFPAPSSPAPATADDGRYASCVAGNMSMATALEALALREDGCAKFLGLGTTDPWIKYRLDHPKAGSGLSSRASSGSSARSPASPASDGKPGSTSASPSGRMAP